MTDQFRKINTVLFWTGVILFVSELWKQYVINVLLQPFGTGQYAAWYFPFQLCSTPMYVCLMLLPALKHKKTEWLYVLDTYLACYGLLGGVFAFFDTSGFTELGYIPLSVHSYLWHILLIAVGLLAGLALILEKRSDFLEATGLFLLFCIIAEIINLTLGKLGIINMFYINPVYRMNQKYFKEIALYIGNNAGILVYISSIILGASILYLVLLCLMACNNRPKAASGSRLV